MAKQTTLESRGESCAYPYMTSVHTNVSPIDSFVSWRKLRLRVDLRLCSISGILFSLNLLDSEILSSASVTTMFEDLDLGTDNRYSVSILIFTVSSIIFQLPSTLAVRYFGPRVYFGVTTLLFGIITLTTAFIHTWKELMALRVLSGITMSGLYPGLLYLISVWYSREEQQLRFAYLQSGEVFILATGGVVNFGLQQLDGRNGLAGWRWIYLVQGAITAFIGILTYFWMVDFPEKSFKSLYFLSSAESAAVVEHIDRDRGDAKLSPFSFRTMLQAAADPKAYGFACMFFCQNIVSTALSYFLPIILQGGLGFPANKAILLAAPPYFYSIIPVITTSFLGDRYRVRGPIVVFNCSCLILGIGLLGFSQSDVARYVGTFLATGAYVSNWAALSAYMANNVVGQWKRAFFAALVTTFNGAGGIAGSFIFRQSEAPRYPTAIWTSIGSQILLVVFVLLFTIAFLQSNARESKGKQVIENTHGFRHTY